MLLEDDKKPSPSPQHPNTAPYSTAAYSDSGLTTSSSGFTESERTPLIQTPHPNAINNSAAPPPYSGPPGGGNYASGSGPGGRATGRSSPHSSIHDAPTGGGKPPPKRGKPIKRFLCAGLIALVICGIISSISVSFSITTGSDPHEHGNGDRDWPISDGDRNLPERDRNRTTVDPENSEKWQSSWGLDSSLLKNEVDPRTCLRATLIHTYDPSSLYTFKVAYSLPSPSTHASPSDIQTFLHSRGYSMGGKIILLGPKDDSDGFFEAPEKGEVRVTIEGKSREARAWNDLHVCRVGKGNSQGMLIVREKSWNPISDSSHSLSFTIYIRFSEFDFSGSRLASKGNLELLTSNMGLTYEDEEGERRGEGRGGMAFEKVLVKGTNSQIKLQHLQARVAELHSTNGDIVCRDCCLKDARQRTDTFTLRTSNGRISGDFCAIQEITGSTTSGSISGHFDAPSIDVRTTNARIDASFTGIAAERNDRSSSTHFSGEDGLYVQTTNGGIHASYAISTNAHSREQIPITFESTNDKLDITALEIPDRVTTNTIITSTNGKITYKGFPNFLGDFKFSSSAFTDLKFVVADTKGFPGRQLSTVQKTKGQLAGRVSLKGSDDKSEASSLLISTSNAGLDIVI